MSFKKTFRAVPVRLGPYYKAKQRRQHRITVAKVLGTAAAAGLAVGLLGALDTNSELSRLDAIVHAPAASSSIERKNTSMPGVRYSGCNDARAAGVAPLYIGEPGYRIEMDGDRDGVACEPYLY